VLDLALSYRPNAFLLSFGDPRPYPPAVKSAGCKLICQVQDVEQAVVAREASADIIVAEGTEAGGGAAALAPRCRWCPPIAYIALRW
jgi:nitronate monooxygenase